MNVAYNNLQNRPPLRVYVDPKDPFPKFITRSGQSIHVPQPSNYIRKVKGGYQLNIPDAWHDNPPATWRPIYSETCEIISWVPGDKDDDSDCAEPQNVSMLTEMTGSQVPQMRANQRPRGEPMKPRAQQTRLSTQPAAPSGNTTSQRRTLLPRISLPAALNPALADEKTAKGKHIPLCWYGVPFLRTAMVAYAKANDIAVYSSATTVDTAKTWENVKEKISDDHGASMGLRNVHGHSFPILAFFSNMESSKVKKETILRIRLFMTAMGYEKDLPIMWYLDKREEVLWS